MIALSFSIKEVSDSFMKTTRPMKKALPVSPPGCFHFEGQPKAGLSGWAQSQHRPWLRFVQFVGTVSLEPNPDQRCVTSSKL